MSNQKVITEHRQQYQKKYRETHKEETKKYNKAYRKAHKEEIKKQKKAYYEAHKEETRKHNKAYRETHREELKGYNKAYREAREKDFKEYHHQYYSEHREEIREKQNKYNRECLREKRKQLLSLFGNKCVKCGFSDPRALQIDHVNGGGKKERENLSFSLRQKKVIESFKKGEKEYQLLCANCNCIKVHENNELPLKFS